MNELPHYWIVEERTGDDNIWRAASFPCETRREAGEARDYMLSAQHKDSRLRIRKFVRA